MILAAMHFVDPLVRVVYAGGYSVPPHILFLFTQCMVTRQDIAILWQDGQQVSAKVGIIP